MLDRLLDNRFEHHWSTGALQALYTMTRTGLAWGIIIVTLPP